MFTKNYSLLKLNYHWRHCSKISLTVVMLCVGTKRVCVCNTELVCKVVGQPFSCQISAISLPFNPIPYSHFYSLKLRRRYEGYRSEPIMSPLNITLNYIYSQFLYLVQSYQRRLKVLIYDDLKVKFQMFCLESINIAFKWLIQWFG